MTCFDSCLKALENYALANPSFDRADLEQKRVFHPSERKSNGAPILLLHSSFIDLKVSDLEDLKKKRELFTELLEKTPINLIDGGVKARERAEYKVDNKYFGDASKLDDINRITVISENYQLIEMFLRDINKKVPPRDVCKKDDWEMKDFGLLSRSNDILIDGYPTEIHVNETSQFLLGNYLTHYGYDIVRLNEDDERVAPWFEELPKKAEKSIIENLDKFNPKYHSVLVGLNNDLSELVGENRGESNRNKQRLLNDFNIMSHQIFISKAEPVWTRKYYEALLYFNKNIAIDSEKLEIDKSLINFINKNKGLER